MGFFGKNSHSRRVAEGGGGSLAAESSALSTAALDVSTERKNDDKSTNVDLFEVNSDESDESDDEATIARYAKKIGDQVVDEKEVAELEKRKVATLNSKLLPAELFKKYDTDDSGKISVSEFLTMLPDLGIAISTAKAMRIFRKCDTDGSGEIDLAEFKMAMFAVDPISGNTLGFSPSAFLGPRDAFELFDEHGTGQIDELEFADVLEYFGMNVSDEKQEKLFKKYDKDKSGYINYQEFRSMWIKLVDVRKELASRGIEVPKYARQGKLQQMLGAVLDKEEAHETAALEEAQEFLQRQRAKDLREQLARKAIARAEDELAAALDAAGQVYLIGSGKYDQFAGHPVIRDEDVFPGSETVSKMWSRRVDPAKPKIPAVKPKPVAKFNEQVKMIDQSLDMSTMAASKPQSTKDASSAPSSHTSIPASKYVRRRQENERWKFRSPLKSNKHTILLTKKHIRVIAREHEEQAKREQEAGLGSPVNTSKVQDPHVDKSEEDLAKLFHENRDFVQSLRFQNTTLMTNTGPLWGRSIVQGAISDSVVFAVTSSGSVYTWGGRNNTWETSFRRLGSLGTDSTDKTENKETRRISDVNAQSKVTPRSALQKMCTSAQLEKVWNPDAEAREKEQQELEARQNEECQRYERLKRVAMYYDIWEPPPSNATRLLFIEQVLIPRIEYEQLMMSGKLRGLEFGRMTKMDLSLAIGECYELEIVVKGEAGHAALKELERVIKTSKHGRNKQVQMEKDKMLQEWHDVKELRDRRHAQRDADEKAQIVAKIDRADRSYDSRTARRAVQLDGAMLELTARGVNTRIEMSGITTRGPPLHSPRGAVAIASVSAGGSHVALLTQDGSLYTCGIGSSGRLGLQPNERGSVNYDSSHPQRIGAFDGLKLRQVSCSYSHSAAIDSDGALYSWGSTSNGKLGVGIVEEEYKQYSSIPLLVKFPEKCQIRFVSCGPSHSGAVSTAGELFMWGSANGGRLGLVANVIDTIVVPTLVRDFTRKDVQVWQVSCGTAHSAICTEVTSEYSGGSKKLVGGQVYVCGGATALGRYILSWERIPELDEVGVRQVACGASHTAAVSSYGELYSWGRNYHGCTGHDTHRAFVEKPELLKCLHVEPYNLALGKPCRQVTIYNEQGPHLAVDGENEGTLATCIHTHLENKPWWEVDLGQPAFIEKIRLWNRTDEPLNPSKCRSEYSCRLFPCWIFVSEFAFKDLEGNEGLRAAKLQSSAFELFESNERMTEWILPTADIVGQYVRVQLQNKNFLHFAELEVLGVYSAFKHVGRIGMVQCSADATLVVMPPISTQSMLDDYYLRAIHADADYATILRQYDAYERSFRKFGRGTAEMLDGPCRLCRAFHKCEICEFYASTKYRRQSAGGHDTKPLPLRAVGDRMGLAELIRMTLAEST